MNVFRLKAVINTVGLSKATIYKMMSDGLFPKSIKLGSRSVGWLATDIEQWLQSRPVSK